MADEVDTATGRMRGWVGRMRGRLTRGWFEGPRLWFSRQRRRVHGLFESEAQVGARIRTDRQPTRTGWWPPRRLWVLAGLVAFILLLGEVISPLVTLLTSRRADGSPCLGIGGVGCAGIWNVAKPLLVFILAAIVFFGFTYFRVAHWYRRKARTCPEDLVLTAQDTLTEIVGRQELCRILIERIRDPTHRCPMVLVGGVGTGKTATLVELTRMLVALPGALAERAAPAASPVLAADGGTATARLAPEPVRDRGDCGPGRFPELAQAPVRPGQPVRTTAVSSGGISRRRRISSTTASAR